MTGMFQIALKYDTVNILFHLLSHEYLWGDLALSSVLRWPTSYLWNGWR